MNKTIKDILILLFAIVLVQLACFVPKLFHGSNADIIKQPEAIMVCNNPTFNETITFSYTYLSESDSLSAYDYAINNNCTFEHKRFELNKTGGINNGN
jgi:hypothetical protein